MTTSPSTAVIVDSIAAQRDHWISECNALRQEVAELRRELASTATHLEFTCGGLYHGTTARKNADNAIASARALLERTKK